MPKELPISKDILGQIYIITCKTSNKNYVGQTRAYSLCIDGTYHKSGYLNRLRGHLWEAHSESHVNRSFKLNNAILKYGDNNFSIKLLHECNLQFLNHFEKVFINEYNSVKEGYNISYGGEAFGSNPEAIIKRAKTLTIVNNNKRLSYIQENRKRIDKAMISIIDNKAVTYIYLDIYMNNPKQKKRFMYHHNMDDIEIPFGMAHDEINSEVDGEYIYIGHKLQYRIPLDRLELYDFNRDDIDSYKESLKLSKDIDHKVNRHMNFKDLKFDKITLTCYGSYGVNKAPNILVQFITGNIYDTHRSRFGGLNSNFMNIYCRALEFAESFTSNKNIEIDAKLLNIVRLLN